MSVFVVLAPGVLSPSVVSEVELEAVHHDAFGWTVIIGYDHHLHPLYDLVRDEDVVAVLCEGEVLAEDEELVEGVLEAA